MQGLWDEFKQFIARGNVIDLAVGLAIGTAFQKIVSSLVNDVIFPSLAPVLKVAEFSDWTWHGVLIGNFIKNVADFLIIAVAIFFVVKVVNRFNKKENKSNTPPGKQEELLTEIRDILKEKK
ncbi:MAG: Large-conductance mechanosensitive channel [Parcubacteria group bacterium GW2011_GWA1_47_10]|uniref:Large-conductance mechanosensitive channel n=1 Tax=Candidatus Nomurabacteria bacterium GW2011_GWB1_47_6 TaxID=1618749 RepID=A0A0G1T0X3_9BACT|nr:MAG: Large-conductance mechanosensitive channel [Parcubacteria group bacterium GW2011_GWA1_47_10]KKU75414.1 MAG: Large-conductance mechanosensitive channel [Candidatus Nomurabacteria bacterium GW2011_GWB1_47_6]